MIIEEKKLADEIGCCVKTLKRYLCRAEFNHIKRIKAAPRVYVLKDLNENDKQKIRDLINR